MHERELIEEEKVLFCEALDVVAEYIHSTAKEKGFWPEEGRNFGEAIALMHSELSEALEAHRHGNTQSDKIPEFSGVEEELADTIVRILDIAHGMNYRVAEALLAKLEYNAQREHKHGKEY